jgi:hypothetical protein
MIVARTLASAARSCIQRCRQSRGRGLVCSCTLRADSHKIIAFMTRGPSADIDSVFDILWGGTART